MEAGSVRACGVVAAVLWCGVFVTLMMFSYSCHCVPGDVHRVSLPSTHDC